MTLIANRTHSQQFNIRSFYLGSAKNKTLNKNARFIPPINLSQIPKLFSTRMLPINVALIQVSPPDDFGWMSLGVSVDISKAAAESADVVIAQVNPCMPRVLGRSFIHVNSVDYIVEFEEPLLVKQDTPDIETANTIARHISRLINDGATLQTSLGATTQATLLCLSEKNNLGIHTQYLSDGIMRLVSMGVVNNLKKGFNEGKLVASSAVGSALLYEFMDDNPAIEFHPSDYVNNPGIISRHHDMSSLNTAMEIDLTGQVAADALPCNNFSGVNGMLDFIRGAAMAKELDFIDIERQLKESIHGVYPLHLEEIINIRGIPVTLRPSRPVDERSIQEHYYKMDRKDVISRFFHDKRNFVHDQINITFEIDYVNDLTIVAAVGDCSKLTKKPRRQHSN